MLEISSVHGYTRQSVGGDWELVEHGDCPVISVSQGDLGVKTSLAEDRLRVQSQIADGLTNLLQTTAGCVKQVCQIARSHVESSYKAASSFRMDERPSYSRVALSFSSTSFALGNACAEGARGDYSAKGLFKYAVVSNGLKSTGLALGAIGFGVQLFESTKSAFTSRWW